MNGRIYIPHLTIPILVQTQRAARMLNKQIQQADFIVFDLRDFFLDHIRDEVAASAFGRQRESLL